MEREKVAWWRQRTKSWRVPRLLTNTVVSRPLVLITQYIQYLKLLDCTGVHPSGPQRTIPQHFAVFLFLGKSGGSSPVTGRLNTESKDQGYYPRQWKNTNCQCVGFRKYPYLTPGKIIGNSLGKGGGPSKAKLCNFRKYPWLPARMEGIFF